jgi:hypothetical protein
MSCDVFVLVEAGEVAQSHANFRHEVVYPAGRSSIALLPGLFRTERVPMKSISNLLWMDSISRATLSWTGLGGVGELLRAGRFEAA